MKANEASLVYTVNAAYSKQNVIDYQDNPLVEALPPILNNDQVEEFMHVYPHFSKNERELGAHERYHCVQRLFKYFQPYEKHFDIEQRISRAIRQGYISRNPLKPQYASDMQKIYEMIKQGNYQFNNCDLAPVSSSGFTIIGYSGVGKSKTVERVLFWYPQIIIHTKYNDQEMNQYQLTWLKLDCPYDGSIKGLCTSFFLEIDRLLGENTYNKFASGRNTTTDTMIPRIAQLARRHSLGVLVIDEIQHLSVAKSGGQEKMLNFFVNLVNTIGIPVILIGTSKARSILQGEFRQARRGSGQQGDVLWENMPQNDSWDLIIEGMWDYQWTKKECPLTQEIKDLIYDQSQGIIDIAVKLFAMAQMRAIAIGTEIITPSLINKVAEDNLNLVKPMLLALKSGDKKLIEKYGDIVPLNIDEFVKEHLNILNKRVELISRKEDLKTKRDNTINLVHEITLKLLEYGIEAEKAKKAARQVAENTDKDAEFPKLIKESLIIALEDELLKQTGNEKKKVARVKKEKSNDDLRSIVDEGRKQNKSAYEALKEAGVIGNPVEEFIMTG